MRIAVLQGPNANRLGTRRPEVYGSVTLTELQEDLDRYAEKMGIELTHFQANGEGELIDWVQSQQDNIAGMLCNPAGLTPYGYSLRDALAECGVPVGVVHLSNIHAREGWRRADIFAEIASIYFAGAGWRVYRYALDALVARIEEVRA